MDNISGTLISQWHICAGADSEFMHGLVHMDLRKKYYAVLLTGIPSPNLIHV